MSIFLILMIIFFFAVISSGNQKKYSRKGTVVSIGSRAPEILEMEEAAHRELCDKLQQNVDEGKIFTVVSYKFGTDENGQKTFIETDRVKKTAQQILNEVKEHGPYAVKGGY